MSSAKFALSVELSNPPDEVWDAVMRPALFLHVAAPLMRFAPVGMDDFPEEWEETEYRASMRLFGLIRLGWQAIVVRFPQAEDDTRVLHDQGYSPLLPQWSHRIEVTPSPGGTRYTDRVDFDAEMLTPMIATFVKMFFRHRQSRLRDLAAGGFAALR